MLHNNLLDSKEGYDTIHLWNLMLFCNWNDEQVTALYVLQKFHFLTRIKLQEIYIFRADTIPVHLITDQKITRDKWGDQMKCIIPSSENRIIVKKKKKKSSNVSRTFPSFLGWDRSILLNDHATAYFKLFN